MDVAVRAYGPGDLPEMAAIWNAVVEGGMAFPQEEPLTPEEAEGFFGSQSHCGVAARGMGNKGIGSMLVRDSLSVAKSLGFRVMQFNAVVQENASAIHLYEKEGFRRLGMIPGGFRASDGEYHTIILFYHEL